DIALAHHQSMRWIQLSDSRRNDSSPAGWLARARTSLATEVRSDSSSNFIGPVLLVLAHEAPAFRVLVSVALLVPDLDDVLPRDAPFGDIRVAGAVQVGSVAVSAKRGEGDVALIDDRVNDLVCHVARVRVLQPGAYGVPAVQDLGG